MLKKIIETKKEEIANLTLPPEQKMQAYSFYEALQQKKYEVALIAEVKKASPSKGVMKESFNPVEIAKAYEVASASAVSVLTDQTYFLGKKEYLTAIKKEIALPVLRKDFIIDERQVLESKYLGADAILLIAEVLEPTQLYEFYQYASELQMDCLVEVHSRKSLEGILSVFTPKIIGVNNRNLETFDVSINQTEKIGALIPSSSLFVSESGILDYEDIKRVARAGADAVLVGEALMKAQTPEEGILSLFGARS